MEWDLPIARAYIEYRSERDKVREGKSVLAKTISGLVNLTDKSILNENANKNAKIFPVQRDLLAGIISKHFAANFLPPSVVEAHNSGDIHFHDMDYSPFLPYVNCCLIDLKNMLGFGFKLGNAQIESPKSFAVACTVTSQILAQVASHNYGGSTFANIDQVLAPYAYKSHNKYLEEAHKYQIFNPIGYARDKVIKEIYDGCQSLEYQINTLFSANGQFPFCTLTFGMGTDWLEVEIQKAILQVRIDGLGKEKLTSVFPKLIMFMEEGLNLNPEDPNYSVKQLALECSSKRLYPDIISAKNNRSTTGSSVPVSAMGCRSFLSVWKNENGEEVLDGRNNLGVVSLNLPRIAIESAGDVDRFSFILEEKLKIAKLALDARIDRLRGVKAEVAPILYTEGAFGVRLKHDDLILPLFKDGRSSISLGYIGLHEVGLFMFGKAPTDSEESRKFCLDLVSRLKETTETWRKESEEGWGYSLYATPSESLCDRFCRLDAKKFGLIEGITDKEYYTNSFHQDVFKETNALAKLEHEAPYHSISNGGHISYFETPDMKHNLKGLESIWDYGMENLNYLGTNTPSDKCLSCGFDGEFTASSKGFECPVCENRDSTKMCVIRRVCG